MRILLAGILLPLLSCPAWAADDAAIDEIVKPFLKDKPYLALVVGITQPGGHQVLGYGQLSRDDKKSTPAADTIFEIGSITKIYTGTLLADQVLAKRVRLDDPVQKHLPPELIVPRRDDRDITLLHLATHTSSLPVQPPGIGLAALFTKDPANPYGEFDSSKLKKTLTNLKLTQPIGSRFDYSNLGVGILGHALTQVAKAKSYEELLVERIAKPLELADTRLQLSAEQQKRLAPGQNEKGEPVSGWTFACLEGCGGLRSTAHDQLLFIDAAVGRKKTALAEAFVMAHQPWRETNRKGDFVGLCWMRTALAKGKRPLLWHNGGTGGYTSFLAVLPDSGAGVVVLSNSPHSVDAIGMAICQHLDTTGKK